MTRWSVTALVVVACGGSKSDAPTVPADVLDGKATQTAPAPVTEETVASGDTGIAPLVDPHSPETATHQLDTHAACDRFAVLADEGCFWTQRFPPAFRDATTCQGSLETWFDASTPDREKLHRTVDCWARDCDGAAQCMVEIQKSAPPPPPRECGQEGTAPIVVDAKRWAARRGAATKRFSDLKTSEQEPVEVCGIEQEVEWMTKVKCNNGTNPYGSVMVANDSRDGYVGRGGECNSILDRYSVQCPEATYPVYVDRYVCPPPK